MRRRTARGRRAKTRRALRRRRVGRPAFVVKDGHGGLRVAVQLVIGVGVVPAGVADGDAVVVNQDKPARMSRAAGRPGGQARWEEIG